MVRLLRRFALLVPLVLIASAILWTGCEDTLTSIPGEEAEVSDQTRFSPELEAAFKAQERNTDDLLSRPGVVGTGIGKNKGGKPVLVVFVESAEKAQAANLPAQVEGLPLRTEVTGIIRPLRDLPVLPASEVSFTSSAVDPSSRFPRPVPIGVSTGHPDITAGTIGSRVVSGSNVYALSNNHVYADENRASTGDNALQPGPYDGGVNPDDAIGTLADYVTIKFDGSNNTVDAAIALSSTGELGNSTPADGYGAPASEIVAPIVGQPVKKYGRTTALTTGNVDVVNVTINVGYDTGTARFVNQIAIKPGGFSQGGDSGSLVVVNGGADDRKAVGLLFAGGRGYTFANPIADVLNAFNVTIDGGSGSSNSAPTVTITSPSDGASFASGASITFEGSASDNEDGDVTASLVWSSSIDGQIGTGGSFTATLSDGSHTITAEATDSNGATGSASVSITVGDQPVGVSIDGITPSSAQAGTTVDVTITGSGFQTGASASFENGSGPAPEASNVAVTSSTELTATVTIKSGGPPRNRVWDVRVTNPDASTGVLAGGFTVTP